MKAGCVSWNHPGDCPVGMSIRPPLTAESAWRSRIHMLVAAFVLAACAPTAVPTKVFLPDTTISPSAKVRPTQPPKSKTVPRLVVAGAAGELLSARAGKVSPEIPPSEYAMYWDYSGAGKLAFASAFWQRSASGNFSVTDFWVYDYLQGKAVLWFASNVGRVLWAPDVANGKPRAALTLFDPARGDFSLAITTAPGEFKVVAQHSSYAFSWAPDGSQIAYVRRAPPMGLYLVSVGGGKPRKLSDFAYQDGGWMLDKPLWILEHDVLMVADNHDRPLLVVPLDGSADFFPMALNGGNLPGPRPDVMLWDRDSMQLVLSGESGLAHETWAYKFSSDLRTVENSVWLADATLKGWWQPGESVLLLGPAGAEVHALPAS